MWYFLTLCVLVLGPKGAQPKDARHCVPCEPVVFSVLRLQFCSLTGQRKINPEGFSLALQRRDATVSSRLSATSIFFYKQGLLWLRLALNS